MRHSESIKEIAAALAAFQSEVKDPSRNGENPHFKSKYVQLDGLLAAVRPILANHGLSLMQSTGGDGVNISVSTLIMHTSGEWIETEPLVLKAQQATPQGAGSACTYGRRFSLSAALGVAWDDDDDGNAASTPPKEEKQKAKVKATKQKAADNPKADYKSVTLHKIAAAAQEIGLTGEDVKGIIFDRYKKESSAGMTDAEVKDLDENLVSYAAEYKDNEAKLTEGM